MTETESLFDALIKRGWDALAGEEQDALIAAGWHPGMPFPSHETVAELRAALEEAVDWARRPSPIPIVPFDEFLERMGRLGIGPRKQTVTKTADLPITGERPRDVGAPGATT